jgi:hypothetical protein
MSKRPGYHDAFIRIPEELWARFVSYVETLSPKRSATQQVVHLIDQFMAREAPATQPARKPRKGRK